MPPETPADAAPDFIASLEPGSYEHRLALHLLEHLFERSESVSVIRLVRTGMDKGGLGLSKTKEIVDELFAGGYIGYGASEGTRVLTEHGEDFCTTP